jgi:hypothetical protein
MTVVAENTGFAISIVVGGPSPIARGELATFQFVFTLYSGRYLC